MLTGRALEIDGFRSESQVLWLAHTTGDAFNTKVAKAAKEQGLLSAPATNLLISIFLSCLFGFLSYSAPTLDRVPSASGMAVMP